MKTIKVVIISILFAGIASCGDDKKEQEKLDHTLDAIESVEQDIDETIDKVEKKSEEVEAALKELDNL